MVSPFDNAVETLLEIAHEVCDQVVDYSDGTNTAEISAIQGSTTFINDDGEELDIEWEGADWIVDVDKVKLAGVIVTPAEGHTIKTRGANARTYTICAPGGVSPVRYVDRATRTQWRLHSKETA